MKRIVLWMLVVLLMLPVSSHAQSPETYDDGRFSLPLPTGWTNKSTPERAHFERADGKVSLYAQSLAGTDARGSANAVLTQLVPELAQQPLQVNEVPLPNGLTWVQQVYLLPDGRLIAALSTAREEFVYVFIAIGEQTAFMTAQAVINKSLTDFNIKTVGSSYVPPDYADPTKFTEQEVTVVSGEFRLPGTLTLPNGVPNAPVVVLVTGSGAQDRNGQIVLNRPQQDLAWGLATLGIASLRYDERTYTYGAKLGAELTIDGEVTEDVVAAAALLRQTPGIDPKRVYVIGHSLGAIVAPRIGERDPQLAGLVLLAGSARPFEDVIEEQAIYLASLTPNPNAEQNAAYAELHTMVKNLRALRKGDATGIPAAQLPYLKSLAEYDQVATAQKLAMPMLILQGERDYQVTMADFALWQSSLKDKTTVTYKSYPTLNHLFARGVGKSTPGEYSLVGHVDSEVIADIGAWILGK